MYVYGPMMDGSDWGWGAIMMMVWLVVVLGVIYFLLKVLMGQGASAHLTSAGPLNIIKERYAKGEIKKEEYERLKKDLQ